MAGPPLPPKPRQYTDSIDDKFADVYNSLNKLTNNQSFSSTAQDSIYNLYGDAYSDTENSPVNPNLSSMHERHLVVGPTPNNRRAAVLPPPKEGQQQHFSSSESAYKAVPSRQTPTSSFGSNFQFADIATTEQSQSTLHSPKSFLTSEQPYPYGSIPSPLTGPSVHDSTSTYSSHNSPKLVQNNARSRSSQTPLPHEVLAREDPYAHLQQSYNSPLAQMSSDSFSSPATSVQQPPSSLYPPPGTVPPTPPTQQKSHLYEYPSLQAQSSMHNAQLQSYVQSRASNVPNNNIINNNKLRRRTMDTSFPGDEYTEAYYDELQYNEIQSGLKGFDPFSIVKPQLIKDLAVQFKDNVPRGTHVKGSVPFETSFTGKDIVSTIRELFPTVVRNSSASRSLAVQVARTLQSQLYFFEVEFNMTLVTDDVQEIFVFPDEVGLQGAGSDEIPTGVFTALTPCYR